MTAPLSSQFEQEEQKATGMFGGPRRLIAPRGAQSVVQDGPIYAGSAGVYWNQMPAIIGGIADFAGLSTETGSPMRTPDVGAGTGKVGGGAAQAEVPDYGGTAAY